MTQERISILIVSSKFAARPLELHFSRQGMSVNVTNSLESLTRLVEAPALTIVLGKRHATQASELLAELDRCDYDGEIIYADPVGASVPCGIEASKPRWRVILGPTYLGETDLAVREMLDAA